MKMLTTVYWPDTAVQRTLDRLHTHTISTLVDAGAHIKQWRVEQHSLLSITHGANPFRQQVDCSLILS